MRDFYQQDIIQPKSLSHGVDFGDPSSSGESLGYYYNFLFYTFAEGNEEISATHYLDEPDKVALHHSLQLMTSFTKRVLMFLMMRYASIQYQGVEGYEPLPDDVRSEIEQAVTAHIKQII